MEKDLAARARVSRFNLLLGRLKAVRHFSPALGTKTKREERGRRRGRRKS